MFEDPVEKKTASRATLTGPKAATEVFNGLGREVPNNNRCAGRFAPSPRGSIPSTQNGMVGKA
eukprot:3443818-Lingulodinium_polyedra.AAC.1